MLSTRLTMFLGAALLAGLAAAAVDAQDQPAAPPKPPAGQDMMGGDMMGTMPMMQQMSQMMQTCNAMMQGAMRHPDEPPKGSGSAPDQHG
jgi:hypothetical protein